MKRLVVLFVAVLIAASVAIFVNKGSGSKAGEAVGASVDSRDTGERAARGRVAIDSPLPEAPRRLPGQVIGGRTTLVIQLIDGIDLSDEAILGLSRFISRFTRKTNSVLYTHAAFSNNENGLLQIDISVPSDVVANLRIECYEEVAQIIGDDNLKRFAEMNRLVILDSEFENYGEYHITITAEAKEIGGLDLVHLRKETQRMLAGYPITVRGEGDWLRPDLVKRYDQIGEEIDRRVPPSK